MKAARKVCDELAEAYSLPKIEPFREVKPSTSHAPFKQVTYSDSIFIQGMEMPYLIKRLDEMDARLGHSEYRARLRVWANAMFQKYGYQEALAYYFCNKKFLARNINHISKYLTRSGLDRGKLKRAVMDQATGQTAIPQHLRKMQQILT